VYLYTGGYSDEFYPILGVEHRGILNPPGGHKMQSDQSHSVSSMVKKNLNVYLCAKDLAIEPLKALAVTKFESRCRDDVSEPVLAAIFHLVYESTDSKDIELRIKLMRICHYNRSVAEHGTELVSAIKMHEPMAWILMQEICVHFHNIQAAAKSSQTTQQAKIDSLEAQCKKLESEEASATTAVVKFNQIQPSQGRQALSLIPSANILRNSTNHSNDFKTEASKLLQENQKLQNKQKDLERQLRQENGRRRNQQHNFEVKISILGDRLAKLKNVQASNHAWGALNLEKASLEKRAAWLKDIIVYAQKRVKDIRECTHCNTNFWGLLKVDLEKNDVYIKCGSCGQKH
jgi:DNA repair exonuclease SbcCD ATPase subunit